MVSGKLKGYSVSVMFENIRFMLDEKGATVENEAGMVMGGSSLNGKPPRRFVVDAPFWAVMKQKVTNRPYFIGQFTNAKFMKASK